MRRGYLFWGVVLILVGGLLLADDLGIKLPNGMSATDLFWPVAMVFGGLWILFGVFVHGEIKTETASIELQGARSANLRISHSAGELKIQGGAAASELLHGTFTGGLAHKADRNGDKLEVRLRPARDMMDFPFFGPGFRLDWDLALNRDVPMALTLNLGANKSTLDLHDLSITDLKLDTGASDTHLILPARGRYRADLDLGAASIEISIPGGLSARIRAELGAVDLKIDSARFPHNGGYYQSSDFDSAANAVDLNIDAGATSIRVK
jgi:hypothetical protein